MRLLESLLGKTLAKPPIWMMRQAGRYLPEYRALRAKYAGFIELCFTPEAAAELTLQPMRRYGLDAAIVFADILTVPHALGQTVTFSEGEGPQLTPLQQRSDVDRLDPAGAGARLAPIAETVRQVRAALPAERALIGFAGAPLTVLTYMFEGRAPRGRETFRQKLHADPALIDAAQEMLVSATIDYLCAQADAGANALQLFDSHAGFLSEPMFADRVITPTRTIIDGIRRRHPHIPIIGFPRGAGALLPRYAAETGVNAIGCDTGTPLAQMQQLQASGVCVQGNLDPYALYGPADALRAEVRRIADALSGGPFVFNLGHGIMPQTPPESVAIVIEELHS